MAPTTLSWLIIAVAGLLLTLSVVVLARLRWIQTRPMIACIVLSVLAHVLLVAIIQLVRVFDIPFVPGGKDSIVVHMEFDDGVPIPEEAPVDEDPTETTPRVVQSQSSPMEPIEAEPADDLPPMADEAPLGVTELDDVSLDAVAVASHPTDELPLDVPPLLQPSTPDPATPDPAPSKEEPSRTDRLSLESRAVLSPLLQPVLPKSLPVEPLVVTKEADTARVDPLAASANESVPEPSLARPPFALGSELESMREELPSPPDKPSFVSATPPAWQAVADRVPVRYRDRIARPSAAELTRRGGSAHTESAVRAALHWLAENQESDGHWSARTHGAGRGGWVAGQNRGRTGLKADMGITGLATLAFLGAGYTHRHGEYHEQVGEALDYLALQQDSSGGLYGNAGIYARMYCHGIATLAVCEAVAMTDDESLRVVARKAIRYTVSSQNRRTGSWRYTPGDSGDTSQFGWQLMALICAEEAGIEVSSIVKMRLQTYLRSVERGNHGGLASYRVGQMATHSMTAEALACRMLLGTEAPAKDREASKFLSSLRPGQGGRNFYYWYYATVGLSQLCDESWPAWNRRLQSELLPTQERRGKHAGSWAPKTVWGTCGGRVYSTAIATLCLESYYRYAPRHTKPSVMITERPDRESHSSGDDRPNAWRSQSAR